MTDLRSELPPLPRYMQRLPVDSRGYPVPWFVVWLDGEENELPIGEGRPEFRVMSENRLAEAVEQVRCWVCGGKMGRYKAFVLGPMCAVNRVNSEPPSHVECADFAGRACPFLSRTHARRREAGMPEERLTPVGHASMRNPKACAIWIFQRGYHYRRTVRGDGDGYGLLFDLPHPTEIRWYAEGRPATRAEVEHSLETGMPELLELCQDEDERESAAMRLESLQRLLPSA